MTRNRTKTATRSKLALTLRDLVRETNRGMKERSKRCRPHFRGLDKKTMTWTYHVACTDGNQVGYDTKIRIVTEPWAGKKVKPEKFDQIDVLVSCTCPAFCLTEDTKIHLLDGTVRTIKELCEIYKDGSSFWVYACKPSGRIVAGKASHPRKTADNVPLLKVTLDNDKFIRCTYDHSFMMRDGSYKQAQQLQPNDSLMPFESWVEDWSGTSYVAYRNNVGDVFDYIYTHRMVAGFPFGVGKGKVVHKNFNSLDNRPENLVVLTKDEHDKLHLEGMTEKTRAGLKRWFDNGGRQIASQRMKKNEVWKYRTKESIIEAGKKVSATLLKMPEELSRRASRCSKVATSWNHSEVGRQHSIDNFVRYSTDPKFKQARSIRSEKASHTRNHTMKQVVDKACKYCANNHKVVSVVPDGTGDGYDITVEEFSNFALEAGIFVHNSYWGPERNSIVQKYNLPPLQGTGAPPKRNLYFADGSPYTSALLCKHLVAASEHLVRQPIPWPTGFFTRLKERVKKLWPFGKRTTGSKVSARSVVQQFAKCSSKEDPSILEMYYAQLLEEQPKK